MKKKKLLTLVSILLVLLLVVSCGPQQEGQEGDNNQGETVEDDNSQEVEDIDDGDDVADDIDDDDDDDDDDDYLEKPAKVVAMKGPTGMGMAKLIKDEQDKEKSNFEFEIMVMPQDVVQGLAKGEIQIASVPANLAATVYNKTEGKIQVAAINTLGVNYIVEDGDTIHSIEDLKGKTIYSTGKGATPENILRDILKKSGLDPDKDVNIEFKSEATEVAAVLAEEDGAIALLPQPFATVAMMNNEDLRLALDTNEIWKDLNGRDMVTGVLVVNREFAESHEDIFDDFLDDYEDSIEYFQDDTEKAAAIIEELGIFKAGAVIKAKDYLNIKYIDESDMYEVLSPYLEILYENNPKSVGGKLPEKDFYYDVDND